MVVTGSAALGDAVVGPPTEVRAALTGQGIEVSDAPLVDLPMGMSGQVRYSTVLKALVASDHCDAVVAVLGSTARLEPEAALASYHAGDAGTEADRGLRAPQADETLRLMGEHGIAFRTPEGLRGSVHAFLNWRAPRSHDGIAAPGEADAAGGCWLKPARPR